jgi:hypothetical protein
MSKSSILLQAAATSRLLEYELKLQKGQGSYAVIKASRSTDQAQCPLWVKSGKARLEHLLPAIPPKADLARSLRDVGFVPNAELAFTA